MWQRKDIATTGKRIDLYFPEHKLTIEIDKKITQRQNKTKEDIRKKLLKKNLVVKSLGSILMEKILISMLKLVKYTITLLN